ncbi:hypothetical protein O9A_00090 [Bartonella koehlerae C-29]|uniref:Uncharacterized protein n=1 Tax=Bartonella koehlerae C-29 TaxID=1134510 RepID=A0A067WBY4_9HYPH|nr:hypothetical protein O9A_00090 [Bartonella koehlerae C-29]
MHAKLRCEEVFVSVLSDKTPADKIYAEKGGGW